MNFGGDTIQPFTVVISIMRGSVVMRGPEAGLGTVSSSQRDLAQSYLAWTSAQPQGRAQQGSS